MTPRWSHISGQILWETDSEAEVYLQGVCWEVLYGAMPGGGGGGAGQRKMLNSDGVVIEPWLHLEGAMELGWLFRGSPDPPT